jgi:CheY-like chemotaxis protein
MISVRIAAAEKHKVLVVEQDSGVRRAIDDAVKGICNPSFAVLASMVFALLLEQRYDLVIIGTTLPGTLQGLDILHLIRALPGYQGVPVICLVGYLQGADLEEPVSEDPVQDVGAYVAAFTEHGWLRQVVRRLLISAASLQPG